MNGRIPDGVLIELALEFHISISLRCEKLKINGVGKHSRKD